MNIAPNEQFFFDQKLDNIKRGIYTFKDIGNKEWINEIEKILLDDVSNGDISEKAKSSLIVHQIRLINNHEKTIDEVDEIIRDLVKERIEKNNEL